MNRRTKRQAGFALVMVMLLVVMAVILGTTYLSIASVKLASSDNYVNASRAKCLAESGLEHAMYILQTNPTQLTGSDKTPLGPYYLDATNDSYTISSVADATVPGRYVITSTGTAGHMKQTASVSALRSGGPLFNVAKGMFASSSSCWLPSSLTVNGDVFVRGKIKNYAVINGNVSATSSLTDSYHLITGTKVCPAASQALPSLHYNNYTTYNLFGVNCNASTMSKSTFAANDPLTGGKAVTASNPGGVVSLTTVNGTCVLPANFKFTGTLVINGNVELGGSNIQLTAVDGFPAIVCSGSVIIDDNTGATINGMVVASGGIAANSWDWTDYSQTTINGGVVSESYGYDYYLNGNHTLNYQPDRCTLYDMSGANNGVVTVQFQNWVH